MKQLTAILLLSSAMAYAGATEGKELFTAKCQACHGPNGEGKAAIAKMYNVTMTPLAAKEIQSKPDAELKKVITAGKGKMKAIAGITEKQAEDVIAYVRTLKP